MYFPLKKLWHQGFEDRLTHDGILSGGSHGICHRRIFCLTQGIPGQTSVPNVHPLCPQGMHRQLRDIPWIPLHWYNDKQ